jgi:hypothetical protein
MPSFLISQERITKGIFCLRNSIIYGFSPIPGTGRLGENIGTIFIFNFLREQMNCRVKSIFWDMEEPVCHAGFRRRRNTGISLCLDLPHVLANAQGQQLSG